MTENNDLIVRMGDYLADTSRARSTFAMDYEEIHRARTALMRDANPELLTGPIFYMGPWSALDQATVPPDAYMVMLVVNAPEDWPEKSCGTPHPLSVAMTREQRVAIVIAQEPAASTPEEIAANMRIAVAMMAKAMEDHYSADDLREVLDRPAVAESIRHARAHMKDVLGP